MSADSKRWIRDYVRTLDHRIRLEKLRADVQAILDARRELRRSKERFGVDVARACYQSSRRLAQLVDRPVPLDVARRFHQAVAADVIVPGTERFVAQWRSHIEELLRTHRITATWGVIAQQNAYAWARLREIEISPINNRLAYTSALHEIGHVLNPCEKSHRPVRTESRRGACVQCELISWRWCQGIAKPSWSRDMHEDMAAAVVTYRAYATPTEKDEIARLISDLGFCRARQARSKR